jgi:hypothetical protein
MKMIYRSSRYKAIRMAVAALALTAVVATVGCAGNKTKKAAGLSVSDVGELVTVAGTLSLRGSTPHTILMIELADGGIVVIQSSTIQEELRTLAGLTVSIEGKLLPWIDGESPLVDAQKYQLMALPSGEVPLVGTVRLQDGQCVLETADKKLFWIRGDFTDLIKEYEGAKVWVVGTVGDAALPDKPEGSVPMRVTGYGVLSER